MVFILLLPKQKIRDTIIIENIHVRDTSYEEHIMLQRYR